MQWRCETFDDGRTYKYYILGQNSLLQSLLSTFWDTLYN